MPFDPTKPVQTRNGRPARIICTDKAGEHGRCIVALVKDRNGLETTYTLNADGACISAASNNDLVNVPIKHIRYINIYRRDSGFNPGMQMYSTEKGAKDYGLGSSDYVTTVEIQFED